jgi:regulator of protease activity HflC (stomatin/prohibitin superfamily)
MKRVLEWILVLIGTVIGLIFFCPQIGLFGPYFTVVREGTAKVVLRFGAYKKVLLCWKDHDVTPDGEIIDVPGKKSRGLQFVGFRRIDTLLVYKFRWKDIQLVEGEEKEQFHEVERDWVLVRPDVYIMTIKRAETKSPERYPINVQFAYILRICHVRKATLVAPPNWFENATVRLNAAHRTFIASHELKDILLLKERKVKITNEEIDREFIEDVLEKVWGVKVEDIGIRDVELLPEYQKAAAAERRAKMEAAGRAQEIFGTVIAAVVEATGKKEKKVRQEFVKNPKAFYETYRPIIDNTMTKLSMEEKAYLRIETPGAVGALGDLLRLIAAWQRMPRGKSKKEEREATKELSREEFEKVVEKAAERAIKKVKEKK